MIKFLMENISIEQFAILDDSLPQNTDFVKIDTAINFKWAIKDKRVAAVTKFRFLNNTDPFIILDVCCSFKIDEDDWAGLINDADLITFPKGFLCHLAMHTVGTSRGILHCKTASTPFNGFIIPPINVEIIINEDIAVNV